MSRAVDEDLIEATIRRVAAEKAARSTELAEPSAKDDTTDVSAETPELETVAPALNEPDHEPSSSPTRPSVDETLIEATLRRIGAEQAARAAEGDVAPAAEPEPEANDDASAAPPEFEAVNGAPAELSDVPAPAFDLSASDAPWADVVRELRRELEDTRRQLHALAARVEAALSVPAHGALGSAPKPAQTDDDWDDTPQLPRFEIGTPPRPAVVRDLPPRTAVAAQQTDGGAAAEIATPPPGKRGLELLARTYRITVEDKRRGVDLVPLHRALLGLDGVRDISLLSYSNGTAIVALDAAGAIDPDVLGAAVSRAMARELKVEVHNEQTMVIKLAED